jgi:hypothetical protein
MMERARRVIRQERLYEFVGLKDTQVGEMIANGEFPKPFAAYKAARTVSASSSNTTRRSKRVS